MAPLSDELLTKIRDGSGRVYTHEAKSMAAELLAFREARAKANTLSGAGHAGLVATPQGGWVPGPPPTGHP